MHRPSLVLVSLLFAPLAAAAEDGASHPHRVALGVTSVSFLSAQSSSLGAMALELSYGRLLELAGQPGVVALAGGLRAALPGNVGSVVGEVRTVLPVEAFVRARLVVPIGWWVPALGPELGFGSFGARVNAFGPSPVDAAAYVAVVASPLRFQVGRVSITALEWQVGTTLPGFGSVLRNSLGLLRIGGSL